jgi:hypothetical protein
MRYTKLFLSRFGKRDQLFYHKREFLGNSHMLRVKYFLCEALGLGIHSKPHGNENSLEEGFKVSRLFSCVINIEG